jgi:DNA repair ATPase RecN
MYFKSIEIENVGPIEQLKIEFPSNGEHPKPVIIVGENGTGKSILLSHLVNGLIVGKQELFDDGEVEHGKVYKYRSPNYITSGKDYSYSFVRFESGVEIQECQLSRVKSDFESVLGYTPARAVWNQIQSNDSSVF